MQRAVEIRCEGRVQGVGFRPHVWRLARAFSINGTVLNDANGVLIRAQGDSRLLDSFTRRISEEAPPLARITRIVSRDIDCFSCEGFTIIESAAGAGRTEIAPDMASCPACRDEIRAPAGRRFRYPFTTCTHCGPRLSVVTGLPYDRAKTTLAAFPLCEPCQAEYDDPADRRFHAETIACPACGPRLVFHDWRGGPRDADDPFTAARALLSAGGILAIKALGGYQLACDATSEAAVRRLRAGKRRDGKPFALMARDIAAIRAHAEVSPLAEVALVSREAPILLLPARGGGAIAPSVAPGLATLGFMLPSNPVQILLFEALDTPLVMTSGNLSGSPQIIDDALAEARLSPLADGALTHDRGIASRIDDSVAREMGGAVRIIRRGRGFAPAAFPLPPGLETAPDLIATGADLKSSFCLVAGGRLVLSQHMGDLDEPETADDFAHHLASYRAQNRLAPRFVAVDMHPGYRSSRLGRAIAAEGALPVLEVQHHHAHHAACLGEHGHAAAAPDVLGIVLDGTGFGPDGTVWGGEILLGGYAGFRRLGRLRPVGLPGGDAAAREPWRNLFAQLHAAGLLPGLEALPALHPLRVALGAKPCALLGRMIESGLQTPLTSSAGRLFDAVAAALGLEFDRQSHEGAAAAMLETLASGTPAVDGYIFASPSRDGLDELDATPCWRALLDDLAAGVPAARIAARFHAGLAASLAVMAGSLIAREDAPRIVALSGGCFQNRVLFEALQGALAARDIAVLAPREVPANDGGIAFGQALVAAARAVG